MAADDRFTEDFRDSLERRFPGEGNKIIKGPVTDWATDFDHLEPAWAHDPYPIQDDLRRRCPVARTERFGGAWLPTRYDDVAAIAYDTDRFSSRSIIVTNVRPSRELAPIGGGPPITSDPPFHHGARKLLLPAFTKKAVERYEPSTRAYCNALIDAFDSRTTVDAAEEYAQHIPARVIADMLGFPPQDAPKFREFAATTLEGANHTAAERRERMGEQFSYLYARIHEHIANPRDDLTTYLINTELNGQKLEPSHVAGTMSLLLIAGLDTTWSAIGASLWHLARAPHDRQRLVSEPDLLPSAVEEFLRAYAPVTMARLVTEDTRWRGADMKADDWILLSFPAANRDPAHFDQADDVIIDRQVNQHAAFGLGIHRCVGSHLARMELRVALQVWLERLPAFALTDPAAVTWSTGQIRGPRTLPVRISRLRPPQYSTIIRNGRVPSPVSAARK
jgi:cytochrome P450